MAKSPLEVLLDKIDLTPVEMIDHPTDGTLYATHEGFLKLGTLEIRVLVLNNGARVIPESELDKVFSVLNPEEK